MEIQLISQVWKCECFVHSIYSELMSWHLYTCSVRVVLMLTCVSSILSQRELFFLKKNWTWTLLKAFRIVGTKNSFHHSFPNFHVKVNDSRRCEVFRYLKWSTFFSMDSNRARAFPSFTNHFFPRWCTFVLKISTQINSQ